MNMDYAKAFELLNRDIEKEERNKMTEKAVHDNLYNKGFFNEVTKMKHIKTSAIIISAALILALIFATSKSRASDDTYIDLDLIEYCNEVGEEYGVCPELLEAIIETESSGRADAVNGSCKGLMQVNANAHRDRMQKLGISSIYDKKGNIIVATDYLLELFEKYEDIGTVLMVYNGTKNAVRRGEQGDYTKYARKIMQRSRELEGLHGKLDY